MAKRNAQPADPFAQIRVDLVEEIGGICKHCDNFADRTFKVAPLAAEIGVPPMTLADYLRGNKEVGRKTLAKFINFLAARKAAREVEAEAVTEAV